MTVTVSSEAMVETPQEGYKGTCPKPKALTEVGPSSPRGWGPLGPPRQFRPGRRQNGRDRPSRERQM